MGLAVISFRCCILYFMVCLSAYEPLATTKLVTGGARTMFWPFSISRTDVGTSRTDVVTSRTDVGTSRNDVAELL